MARLRAYFGYR